MKKLASFVIAFSFLIAAFSPDLWAGGKHGAMLIIVKKDGEVVRGELIAVKPTSVVAMEEVSEVSIDVKDIRLIKVVSVEELLRGTGIGFLLGSIGGALAAAAGEKATAATVGAGAAFFGAMGELVVGLLANQAGVVETFYLEGKSPQEIEEVMKKLNRLARVSLKFPG
ncbi:MAG: hypothetical protein ACE5LC_08115 [Candidatus Aminicenantales bacterium]